MPRDHRRHLAGKARVGRDNEHWHMYTEAQGLTLFQNNSIGMELYFLKMCPQMPNATFQSNPIVKVVAQCRCSVFIDEVRTHWTICLWQIWYWSVIPLTNIQQFNWSIIVLPIHANVPLPWLEGMCYEVKRCGGETHSKLPVHPLRRKADRMSKHSHSPFPISFS